MIDAHVHYWRVDRGDYGWLTPDLPLYRNFGPADAAPLFAAAGVTGIVLVQAAPTEAETEYLLALAHEDPMVQGVVGWIDMEAPDAPDRLASLARDPRLRGIRPMWQDIPWDDWMLRPGQAPAYRAIVDLGLSFDALARVRHLPHIPRLIERHPDLRIVIDHGAKPDIAAGAFTAWREGLRTVASFPHVRCKLSGLITEAPPGAGLDDLRRYAETLIELFGPARLIWGSDWPVLTLRGDYAIWCGWAQQLTAGLSSEERAAIFGDNAAAFYRLPSRQPQANATVNSASPTTSQAT